MPKVLEQNLDVSEAKSERRRFLCPSCDKHTVLWILPTTEIKDLPIKCKLCGKENIINITPKKEN